jgi:hypothetical protein
MQASIPLDQIKSRRWDICARALLHIQINCGKLLDMNSLTISEDEKNLNFIYDESSPEDKDRLKKQWDKSSKRIQDINQV